MPGPPFKVRAVFEYSSPHEDDLNFPNGQVITVTEEEDNDWYYGEYVDGEGRKKAGIFPRNFVERYEPEAPPRPARTQRVRKSESGTTDGQRNDDVPADADAREASLERPVAVSAAAEPAAPVRDVEQQRRQQAGHDQDAAKPGATVPLTPKPSAPALPASTAREEPGRSAVDEKPVPSSFKDRIAAFNKSSAPPPAPMKPTGLSAGGSSFVKKPFVAPPPSRDAYVPVPREVSRTVHRRDAELEREGAPQPQAQPLPEAGPIPEASAHRTEDADTSKGEPDSKPTSLKERIALLQKQQLETARRHGESAQKREQPKKPAKPRPAPVEAADAQQGTTDGQGQAGATVSAGDRPADGAAPRLVGTSALLTPGDANDTDQSGADGATEDPEDDSVEQDGVEHRAKDATARVPQGPAARSGRERAESSDAEPDDRGDDREEADEEEEEDIDPELKRRMEIRDRMAKMSGGMGMHGIFGIPGPPPRAAPAPQGDTRERTQSDRRQDTPTLDSPHAVDAEARSQPTQILPVPLPPRESRPSPRPASPLSPSESMLLSRDPPSQPETPGARQDGSASQDVGGQMPVGGADVVAQSRPPISRESSFANRQRVSSPDMMHNASVVSPPLPSRKTPAAEPPRVLSPSAGSESDDEMSIHKDADITSRASMLMPDREPSMSGSRPPPPPPPPSGPASPEATVKGSSLDRPGLGIDVHQVSAVTGVGPDDHISPSWVGVGEPKSLASPARGRAPPPPPPPAPAVLSSPQHYRKPTADARSSRAFQPADQLVSDDETTAYEGDYDTDIASGASHKAALRPHAPDAVATHGQISGVNAAGALKSPPSAGPPPIPRRSMSSERPSDGGRDRPRAPPPPPPPPPVPSLRSETLQTVDDFDPYRYDSPPARPSQEAPAPPVNVAPPPLPPHYEPADGEPPRMLPSRPHTALPPRPAVDDQGSSIVERETGYFDGGYQHPPLHQPQQAATTSTRLPQPEQQHTVPRAPALSRRSTDIPRSSIDSGFVAADVDLGGPGQWWIHPNQPPPVFQARPDVLCEVEEARTAKRGARSTISKDVYVLFHDYSQTVVSARFDPSDPEEVIVEQRHEGPPPRPRQDQLEAFHTQYGRQIAEAATSKVNNVVGDGSSLALVHDLIKPLPGALSPIGTRAYGALVYMNLANASVQQYDEIRPGDIISFRNSRFQGHRGTMHQKYGMDVGKPDHVGIVVDWDGTKKKVRAWEQGRDGKKVKVESFKLGDLRSGEVKIWRVVGRNWVKWEGDG